MHVFQSLYFNTWLDFCFVHYLSPVENGELLLLDVRPTEEYESGYFPGAISIPIEELEDNVLDWKYEK